MFSDSEAKNRSAPPYCSDYPWDRNLTTHNGYVSWHVAIDKTQYNTINQLLYSSFSSYFPLSYIYIYSIYKIKSINNFMCSAWDDKLSLHRYGSYLGPAFGNSVVLAVAAVFWPISSSETKESKLWRTPKTNMRAFNLKRMRLAVHPWVNRTNSLSVRTSLSSIKGYFRDNHQKRGGRRSLMQDWVRFATPRSVLCIYKRNAVISLTQSWADLLAGLWKWNKAVLFLPFFPLKNTIIRTPHLSSLVLKPHLDHSNT